MAYSIKVNADTTGVKKDIMSLSRELQQGIGGNKKIQLFDRDTRNFIEKGAKNAIAGMTKEVGKLEDANKKILDVLKDQTASTEDQSKKNAELIRNKLKILSIEKDINKTQNATNQVLGQGTKMGQFKGGFKGSFGSVKDLLGKIPGIGSLLQGAMGGAEAGGGMAGMLGGLAGAGTMALGGLAIGRGINGFNTFDQNKGSMISLMGRGYSAGEASQRDGRFQNLGMNAEQARQLRLQSVDTFGRSGSGTDNLLGVAKNARGLGIGADELMGAGQGLRATLGLSGGQKAFAKLQATLITTELDGAIGPFLQTTAAMLTQINEHGIGLDSAALAVMSTFGNAKGMSPEMTQKVFTGIDEAVKGATGENSAFYMSALTSSGIGAGSLGGAQLAQSQGLFGGDAEKLRSRGNIPKDELDQLQKQGIINDDSKEGVQAFQKRAGAISNLYGKVTGNMNASGKALVASKLTGIKDPLAAREAMGILDKAAKGDLTSQDKKRLNDLSKDPQEQMQDRLKEIAASAAGQLDISQHFKQDMSEALGERLAPLGTVTNQLLGNMDKALTYIANFFGAGIQSEAEGRMDRATKGDFSMEEYKGMSPDEQAKLKTSLQGELQNSTQREGYATGIGGKINGMLSDQPIIGGGDKNLFSLDAKTEQGKQQKLLDLLGQIAAYSAVTARHAAKPGNTKIQGSGKTQGK